MRRQQKSVAGVLGCAVVIVSAVAVAEISTRPSPDANMTTHLNLKLEKTPVAEAWRAFGEAAGCKVEPHDSGMFNKGALAKAHADVKIQDATFWEAYLAVAKVSPFKPSVRSGDRLILLDDGGNWFAKPKVTSGPLVCGLSFMKILPSKGVEDLTEEEWPELVIWANFEFIPEPFLRVVSYTRFELEKITDEEGEVKPVKVRRVSINDSWRADMSLMIGLPREGAKKFTVLKGTLGVVAGLEMKPWIIDAPLDSDGGGKDHGVWSVQYSKIEMDEGVGQMELSIQADHRAALPSTLPPWLISVMDKDGNSHWVKAEGNPIWDENRVTFSIRIEKFKNIAMRYENGKPIHFPEAGPPAKMILQLPRKLKLLKLPIEFKDLELP